MTIAKKWLGIVYEIMRMALILITEIAVMVALITTLLLLFNYFPGQTLVRT